MLAAPSIQVGANLGWSRDQCQQLVTSLIAVKATMLPHSPSSAGMIQAMIDAINSALPAIEAQAAAYQEAAAAQP